MDVHSRLIAFEYGWPEAVATCVVALLLLALLVAFLGRDRGTASTKVGFFIERETYDVRRDEDAGDVDAGSPGS